MKWLSDLINPEATHADNQEWLQLAAFLVAVLIAACSVYLVMSGAVKGPNAVNLLLGFALIFLVCTGLLGGAKVLEKTAVAKEKIRASLPKPPDKPAEAKPVTPNPTPESKTS